MIPEESSALAELHTELRRIAGQLGAHLAEQRRRGRSADTDPLRGMAIDEGEAEALAHELAAGLAQPFHAQAPPPVETTPNLGETPLRRIRRVFGLHTAEFDALLLALAVELDGRFARLVAFLNDHIARTRPTLDLALTVAGAGLNPVELCALPALRLGLLVLEGDGPLSGRSLKLAPEFLARLAASDIPEFSPPGVRLHCGDGPSLEDLPISPAQRPALDRWATAWRQGTSATPLLLVGPIGAGRALAAQAAAASAGLRLIETLWPGSLDVAARETLWHEAALLIRSADTGTTPPFAELWATLAEWKLPLVLALPKAWVEPACSAAPVEPIVVELQSPSIQQREALWAQLLPPDRATLTPAERRDLATRYDFPPGLMARAVRRAVAASESYRPDFATLSQSCRAVGSASMSNIAQALALPYSREDMVLPPTLLGELDLARAWVRNRRRVFEDWGFGRRIALGQGLTALFTGDPGTGKTMAAQVLAHELGLDLFRVDLSQVMSKYIGETEKNLAQLFNEARASGAILFFDEADALFGKRTAVKDAHDRYANLEIGYLLQRMEEHTGTTVLATNRLRDLDEAFTRRFHFILHFPMPGPAERRLIWEGMLPRHAEREADIDLDGLARDWEISGGEIRNSALCAAFSAAEEGAPIGLRHLKRGLLRELLKTGRVLDSRQRHMLEGD